MSSRRRGSSKRRDHRQVVSGNPQRRAEQLRAAEVRSVVRQLQRADPDREGLGELAYRLAGGAPAAAWWRESHERILTRARGLSWPTRLADLETQACQIVGDEFYERLQSPTTGLHPAQWLRALAEETGAAVRAAAARGGEDWPRLWAFLCGLVLTTPAMLPDAASETSQSIREMFPDIADPPGTSTRAGFMMSSPRACSPRPKTRWLTGVTRSAGQAPARRCRRAGRG